MSNWNVDTSHEHAFEIQEFGDETTNMIVPADTLTSFQIAQLALLESIGLSLAEIATTLRHLTTDVRDPRHKDAAAIRVKRSE